MKFKKMFARLKLRGLIRDIDQYSSQSFSDAMSRIAQEATGIEGAEELRKQLHQLKNYSADQAKIIAGLRARLAIDNESQNKKATHEH